MYIVKNALRCIVRSRGRSILIGIIALVIAIAACLGLSIRQAAESAKQSALDGMSVTATISYDRTAAMEGLGGFGGGRPSGGFPSGGFDPGSFEDFDREQFEGIMSGASSLTLAEYEYYATAPSVKDFYYTVTAYFNSDTLLPVSNSSSSSSSGSTSSFPSFPGGFNGMGMGASGDFTVVGYSGYNAMTDFVNGTSKILEGGEMFDEGTSAYHCVISKELSIYNEGLAVGDTITLTNPTLESETYTLTIVGIYESTETNDFSMSQFGASQDPANRIYVSAPTLNAILDASAAVSTTVTDSNDRERESKLTSTLTATYALADVDAYEDFCDEVRELGLADTYAVSSSDLTAFENSMTPLNTLSTLAGWFLAVILLIGGVILVVLNIFNVRERKYEVGVLTAMGMKKWKVAAQFMCEILIITMLAVLIGAGIGAVSSVPVTNALLEGQTTSQNAQWEQMGENFGRPGNMPSGSFPGNMPQGGKDMGGFFGGAANYVTEVNSAMNLVVVFEMIGVGLLLTLIASAAAITFIMRYDPLKILANRD